MRACGVQRSLGSPWRSSLYPLVTVRYCRCCRVGWCRCCLQQRPWKTPCGTCGRVGLFVAITCNLLTIAYILQHTCSMNLRISSTHEHAVLELARARPLLRARDLAQQELPTIVLSRLVAAGKLERVARGVYGCRGRPLASTGRWRKWRCVYRRVWFAYFRHWVCMASGRRHLLRSGLPLNIGHPFQGLTSPKFAPCGCQEWHSRMALNNCRLMA